MARARAGFTLIELMISVALLAVVAAGLFRTFGVNHQTYVVVDGIAESQQNLRAIAELIERDMRHAGLMVPEGTAVCGVDDDAGPDLLYLSDAEAIDPGLDKDPYDGARVQTATTNVSTGSVTLDLDSLVLEPSPPLRAAYDTNGDSTNDSDFRVGGGAIVADFFDPSRGVACGPVTNVDLANDRVTIDIETGALGAAAGPVQLVVVPAHEYRIDALRLFRNDMLLAKDIEDLQVAFIFDDNANNLVDPGETRGDGVGVDYDAGSLDASEIRRLRANLVGRTRAEDPNFTTGRFQAMENRNPGASDNFRRRVHTSTVMLRNVGTRVAGL